MTAYEGKYSRYLLFLYVAHCLFDLTNFWQYILHDANCLQNVRTNYDFLKTIKNIVIL